MLRIVIFVLLLFLLAVAGIAWYTFGTESGLRFALVQAERFTKGSIHVGSASGRFLGELDLRDIRYTGADGSVITVAHVHLLYEPRRLLDRRLHVKNLLVETVDLRSGPQKAVIEPAAATRLPVRLPVDVVIDAFVLDGFAMHSATVVDAVPAAPADAQPEAPPFAIEHAELAGQWLGDTIEVQRLATSLPQTGPLQLQAKATMSSDHIDFEQLLLQGPGEIAAKGRVGIDQAASDLGIDFKQLHWPLVLDDKTPQAAEVHGTLHVTGTTAHYTFDLTTDAVLQGRAAKLATTGSGSLQDAQIDTLLVDLLPAERASIPAPAPAPADASAAPAAKPAAVDTAERKAGKRKGSATKNVAGATKSVAPTGSTLHGTISASGHVAWAPAISATIKAELAHVDPSLFVAGLPGDINGRLDSTTTIADGAKPNIVFTADITRSTLQGQAFSLSAKGSTNTERAKIENLLLQAGAGRVQAQGEVAWIPRIAANLDAQISKLDPALFAPEWPGEINGKLSLHTDGGAKPTTHFDAQIADSRIRSYPLKLDTRGTLGADQKTVILEQLKLDSGPTSLSASGQVTPPFDASGHFESPDLAAFVPKLTGRAAFDFRLAGTIDDPHVVTHGDATDIRYGEQTVQKLAWDADVDPEQDSHAKVTVTEANAGITVQSVVLNMTGREVYHHAELDVVSERGNVEVAVQGGFDRKRGEWGGELTALALKPDGFSSWSLDKGAGILLGKKRRSLEKACLAGDEGRACFNLEQNVLSNGTRVGWNIERLLLHAFQPFLQPQNRVSGSIDGEGAINFTGGDVADLDIALNLNDTRLDVPDGPPFVLQTGTVRAEQRDGRLHGAVDLKLEQGLINADVVAAPGADFAARALSGDIKLDVPSLAFLEPLLPQLRSLDGKLEGGLKVGGTPSKPSFDGQIQLSDAHAKLVLAGIEVKDVQLKIVASGEKPLQVDGSLTSEGTLKISGQVDPFAKPLLADIAVKGENFQAMNTAQARAWVSPDLHLVRDAKGATLKGEVVVPHAEITPKGLGGGGVEVSQDQVLVGAQLPPPEAALPVFVDLKLTLGDKVDIEGLGLKTRIEGGVTVTQEPRRDAQGRGELRLIDGRYAAYGQDLKIETGRLIFTGGPVTTPAVDIYATRHPRDDILVGVHVRGTLARPELTLESTPSMPREQQLAWLVLGRSLETSSTQDRSAVSSAAMSLGLGGGDYVAGLLGKKIGLDQLSVGDNVRNQSEVAANAQNISGSQAATNGDASATAAQLTLGKYLTPRLFVSYGISLFQQGYSFRLLYTLGHGFKLATETGTANGGDLIYQTERGKRKTPPPEAAPATSAEPDPNKPVAGPLIETAPPIETPPAPKN